MTPQNNENFIQRYKELAEVFTQTTSQLAIIAAKGPSTYLSALGGSLLIAAIVIKILPGLTLQPSEFISLVFGAIVLIGLGSYFRFYQYKTQQLINEELRNLGIELLQKTEENAKELIGKKDKEVDL